MRSVLLCLALLGTSAVAASDRIGVTATVRPYARLDAVALPRALHVGDDDIERGYIDVSEGGQWSVRTNAPRWQIDVEVVEGAGIVAVEVRGLDDRPRILGPHGGTIARHGPLRATLAPTWRLHLGEGVEPGSRAWPVRVGIGVPGAR
jgi:hypothetical protein